MIENRDHPSDLPTEVLASLTLTEQLQVILAHPLFTSKCPQCGYQFPTAYSVSACFDCPACGWIDNLNNLPYKSIVRNNSSDANHANGKRLGSYLVEAGLLTPAQVDAALVDQASSGMRFGEILVKLGWINQQTIEYLMKKLVLPERAAAQRRSFSDSESKHYQSKDIA